LGCLHGETEKTDTPRVVRQGTEEKKKKYTAQQHQLPTQLLI